jgi:hypothetical protein
MPSGIGMGGDVDGIVERNVTVWLHKTELLDLGVWAGACMDCKKNGPYAPHSVHIRG